ncbi:hypothetical protein I6F43_07915 [Pseudoalteromonas sp. NZS71_1]|uniref:hypothetical protein n=1 Tax=Pseudoalteromonas sp. NZS71_1 TaxID=2792072 RepID=UPI0018CEA08F|nr:hypothetical protein [Pseudoalteromonas sp. NZS71_1]MBH0034606.1 hypothetical protein [Pseudoalteromonas sp. NZS71_1]
MQDKLTNIEVQPVGCGEHCHFTLRIDTNSEHLEAYFNKNDTKTTIAYKLRALAEKIEVDAS